MAIITFSPGWRHVRGHVGGFVYKCQQGKDILADKPDREPPRNSPAQLAQQDLFRQATVYANGTKHDAGVYAAYQAKARERRSNPFAVAIRDWMNAPEVTAIDLSGYTGHAGDVIWVAAQDDMEVTGWRWPSRTAHTRRWKAGRRRSTRPAGCENTRPRRMRRRSRG